MKLVVGLGNPGRQYVGTRHNVGFDAVDALAMRLGWIARGDGYDRLARSNFDALALDGSASLPSGRTEKLLLLKPMTYMNLSGKSVSAAAQFYQAPLADIMVVLDEMALPCGRIRIRPSGSDGGHNGLRDIQRLLGSGDYPRLRIGIDAPPAFIPGRDYVLGRPTPEQRKQMDAAIGRAVDALVAWMDEGVEAAMNRFNAKSDE